MRERWEGVEREGERVRCEREVGGSWERGGEREGWEGVGREGEREGVGREEWEGVRKRDRVRWKGGRWQGVYLYAGRCSFEGVR